VLLCGVLLLWQGLSAEQHQVSTPASQMQSAAEPDQLPHLLFCATTLAVVVVYMALCRSYAGRIMRP
jgi:hypothetical protein